MLPTNLAYTTFMMLALAVFLAVRGMQPKLPAVAALPLHDRLALLIAGFVGGVFGAKLPFVAATAGEWLTNPQWLADGKTITTGLVGAYLAVELTKWALGIRVKTGVAFALPLALALAVGRIGCFFNPCCYGRHTSAGWGVDFLGDGPRHPTQIYESLFHLAMALALLAIMRRRLLEHQRLKFYLIAYAGFRFVTEFIRPAPSGLAALTFYQWVAVLMIVGLGLQWIADSRTRRTPGLEAAS